MFCFFSLDDKRVQEAMSTEAYGSVSTDPLQFVLQLVSFIIGKFHSFRKQKIKQLN